MGSGGDRNLPFIFTGQVLHQQLQCLLELHLLRTILRPKKMGASVCPLASWSASLLLQPPHLLILTGLLVSYWETEPSHAAASSTEKRDGVGLLSEDKRLLSEAAAKEVLVR